MVLLAVLSVGSGAWAPSLLTTFRYVMAGLAQVCVMTPGEMAAVPAGIKQPTYLHGGHCRANHGSLDRGILDLGTYTMMPLQAGPRTFYAASTVWATPTIARISPKHRMVNRWTWGCKWRTKPKPAR